jgi:hypothetical protein
MFGQPPRNDVVSDDDVEVPDELALVAAWLIEQLARDGFESDWAGRLAAIPDIDYREAIVLLHDGCSQKLVYEILS